MPPLATGKVPVTPVVRGKPTRFVAFPLVGVPNNGVTRVGLVDKTDEPVPVEVVTPVPPLFTANVPVVPATMGKPVALVRVAADGVPKLGVVKVGEVERTTLPVPVEVVTPVPPRTTESVPVVPATMGKPVALVSVAAEGVPKLGVVKVGEVLNAMPPEPVTFCPNAVATPVPNEVIPVPPLATGKTPVTLARA